VPRSAAVMSTRRRAYRTALSGRLRNIRDRSSGFPAVVVPGGTDNSMLMPDAGVATGSARHDLYLPRRFHGGGPLSGLSGLGRYEYCARWPLTGPHHLVQRGMERPAQVRCCLPESLTADRGIEFIL